MLGVVAGEMLPGGRWDFRADGEPLAAIEILGRDDETPIDLVAWPVEGASEQFGTLLGRAVLLGEARVRNPATYFGGKPLRVFSTPLAWLHHKCLGVVILDPALAAPLLAEALGFIAGEDVQHGRQLAHLLRHLVHPRRVVAPIARAA